MNSRNNARGYAYDDQTRHAGAIYILMLVVALAFGGFLWQLYSAPEVAHIAAAPGPYKMEPPPQQEHTPDAGERAAVETAAPETEAAAPASVDAGAATAGEMPRIVSSGPYVAQLAALQTEPAAGVAWQRLSSRAPQLFAAARLDVERADLGARGTYYRVRAGYFPDRANAARFCERIRQMGQDCIVAAR